MSSLHYPHFSLWITEAFKKIGCFFAVGQGCSLHRDYISLGKAMWRCGPLLSLLTPWAELMLQRNKEGRFQSKGREAKGVLKGSRKEPKMELPKGNIFRSHEHQEKYPK